MTSETIPVFLNGRPVQVPPDATLNDMLLREDPALAAQLAGGLARATDGRGVAIDGSAPLPAGAIVRIFRSARASAPGEPLDA